MTPDEYCQQKAAQSGSSFYYSFLFLPPDRRRAITALYAFCREVDDAVDEAGDPAVARAKLAWWRDEIARLFRGAPQHPVSRALAPAVRDFGVTEAGLSEIMDGMEMDLAQSRYLDYAGLRLYCHRVAGVVGTLAAGIFGHTDPRTLEYAERLGLAFQLTNIIRDVGEDARKNRIYLPQDEMTRFGVSERQIAARDADGGWAALMQFQVERARAMLERGAPLALALPGRIGLEIRTVVQGGLRILQKIDRVRGDVFRHRPVLHAWDWPLMLSRALSMR